MEIEVGRDILEANNDKAQAIKQKLIEKKIFVLNIMSSPGAGKTTLLEATIKRLKNDYGIAVIEGDIQTTRDADRIAQHGVKAVQINTRGACHLDADMIDQALEAIDLDGIDILIIENVGNLVCPAEFNLGEQVKVVILSTPEGEDKPSKYPLMFRLCQALVINKTDLLPYLPFSMENVRDEVKQINPALEIFETSALKGEGMDTWLNWLRAKVAEINK